MKDHSQSHLHQMPLNGDRLHEILALLREHSIAGFGCIDDHGGEDKCDIESCSKDPRCHSNARKLFLQLWNRATELLDKEQRLLRIYLSRSAFEAHVEDHADITQRLSSIAGILLTKGCCHAVLPMLEDISKKITQHFGMHAIINFHPTAMAEMESRNLDL